MDDVNRFFLGLLDPIEDENHRDQPVPDAAALDIILPATHRLHATVADFPTHNGFDFLDSASVSCGMLKVPVVPPESFAHAEYHIIIFERRKIKISFYLK